MSDDRMKPGDRVRSGRGRTGTYLGASTYWRAVSGRRLSLLALSTPLPGAPDVRLASDQQVFSPVQVLELCAELDRINKATGARRLRRGPHER